MSRTNRQPLYSGAGAGAGGQSTLNTSSDTNFSAAPSTAVIISHHNQQEREGQRRREDRPPPAVFQMEHHSSSSTSPHHSHQRGGGGNRLSRQGSGMSQHSSGSSNNLANSGRRGDIFHNSRRFTEAIERSHKSLLRAVACLHTAFEELHHLALVADAASTSDYVGASKKNTLAAPLAFASRFTSSAVPQIRAGHLNTLEMVRQVFGACSSSTSTSPTANGGDVASCGDGVGRKEELLTQAVTSNFQQLSMLVENVSAVLTASHPAPPMMPTSSSAEVAPDPHFFSNPQPTAFSGGASDEEVSLGRSPVLDNAKSPDLPRSTTTVPSAAALRSVSSLQGKDALVKHHRDVTPIGMGNTDCESNVTAAELREYSSGNVRGGGRISNSPRAASTSGTSGLPPRSVSQSPLGTPPLAPVMMVSSSQPNSPPSFDRQGSTGTISAQVSSSAAPPQGAGRKRRGGSSTTTTTGGGSAPSGAGGVPPRAPPLIMTPHGSAPAAPSGNGGGALTRRNSIGGASRAESVSSRTSTVAYPSYAPDSGVYRTMGTADVSAIDDTTVG